MSNWLGGGRRCERRSLPLASHSHDPSKVLWVGVDLGLEYRVCGIGLGIKARGLIVSVTHVFGVVDNDHSSLERHDGQGSVNREYVE